MSKKFLSEIYAARDTEEVRDQYDAWSDSYDQEISENGYATPKRIAKAIGKYADKSQLVLDYGCGTGLCGAELKKAGFSSIDGVDLSAEMLAQATEKDIYSSLTVIDPDAPSPIAPGSYHSLTACGLFGVGAAPIELFDQVYSALASGGVMAFSFNDHALADPAYEAKVNEYVDCGAASLLFRQHGEHLPGIDLRSMVYVIRKN